jgi:hypothetical protein
LALTATRGKFALKCCIGSIERDLGEPAMHTQQQQGGPSREEKVYIKRGDDLGPTR